MHPHDDVHSALCGGDLFALVVSSNMCVRIIAADLGATGVRIPPAILLASFLVSIFDARVTTPEPATSHAGDTELLEVMLAVRACEVDLFNAWTAGSHIASPHLFKQDLVTETRRHTRPTR